MNNEQLQTLLNYLDKIGEKIGKTGEQIWPWLIRQQYVESLYSLFWLILFIGLSLFTYKSAKSVESWDEPTPKSVAVIILGIVCAFGLFISDFSLSATKMFNPEYYALKDLLRMVK